MRRLNSSCPGTEKFNYLAINIVRLIYQSCSTKPRLIFVFAFFCFRWQLTASDLEGGPLRALSCIVNDGVEDPGASLYISATVCLRHAPRAGKEFMTKRKRSGGVGPLGCFCLIQSEDDRWEQFASSRLSEIDCETLIPCLLLV